MSRSSSTFTLAQPSHVRSFAFARLLSLLILALTFSSITPTISAQTPEFGCIRGRLIDAGTGVPLSGGLWISGPTWHGVEVNGDYRVCNILAGDYWVVATSPAYLNQTHNGDDTCGHDCAGLVVRTDLLQVRAGEERTVDFALSRAAGVRGRVTDRAGQALEAQVYAYRLTGPGFLDLGSVSTDADGVYEFPAQFWGGGGYKLVVRSNRHLPGMTGATVCTSCNPMTEGVPIELPRGSSRTVDFQLEERFGVVTGRVIDRFSRSPIEGAYVVAPGHPDATTTTDAEGRYTLEVEKRPFRIYAEAYDYATQVHPCRYRCDLYEVPEISLGPDATATIDFELSTIDLWHVTPSWSRLEGGDMAQLHGRRLDDVVELRMNGTPIPFRASFENYIDFQLPPHREGAVTFTVVDNRGASYDLADGLVYWRGSAPRRVRDIEPHVTLVRHDSPPELVGFDGDLYFLAQGTADARSIWQSDGTPTGNRVVDHIGAEQLTPFRDRLYFIAASILHRSDGTEAGTEPVRTSDGLTLRLTTYLSVVGDRLYFRAIDERDQHWIWTIDRTGIPRKLLRIFDGESLQHVGQRGNRVLFGANGSQSNGLWISDGTPEGTLQVTSHQYPSDFTELNGKTYFVATGANGTELMVTDGTTAGTRLVIDLEPSYRSSYPRNLVAFRNRIYFQATSSRGTGVWSTDGTESGTRFVSPGRGRMLVLGSHLYFLTDTELRRTDGLTISRFREVDYGDLLTVADDRLWYEEHNQNRPCEATPPGCTGLWASDGTTAGTIQLGGVVRYGGAYPVSFGSDVCFPAIDAVNGAALFCVNKRDNQLRLVMKFAQADWFRSSNPQLFPTSSGRLFINAFTAETGRELWISDLTEAGTRLLQDINPGPTDGSYGPVLEVGDRAIFGGATEQTGVELWVTEGSPETTMPLAELRPGPEHGIDQLLFTIDGRAYFFEHVRPEEPTALWSTDGTVQGTRKELSVAPQSPLAWRSTIVFAGDSQRDACKVCQWIPATGEIRELWRPDEVHEKPIWSARLEESGGSLFVHVNGVGWGSLYRVDAEGPSVRVSDFPVGQIVSAGDSHLLLSRPWTAPWDRLRIRRYENATFTLDETIVAENGAGYAVIAGERVFIFVSRDSGMTRDLWVVDQGGLKFVTHLSSWAGESVGTPEGLIFFSNATRGDRELWQSDGSPEGTRRAWDVNRAGSSNPTQLRLIGPYLVFVAGSPEDDLEPWVVRYKPEERQRAVRPRGTK